MKHFCQTAVVLSVLAAFPIQAKQTGSAAAAKAAETLPDAAALQRLARRSVMNATGRRMNIGPVTLKEKLADGSYLIDVTLENGRKVRGRLFRDRLRYKITLDRREIYAREKVIIIKKDQ